MRDYVAVASKYARAAVADTEGRLYCKWVRLACARHLNDLKRQRARDFAYRFDPWHGNDVCDFVEKLPHIEGAWETKTLKLEPAQIFWLVSVFGWRRKVGGFRRFSRVYIEVARKNAKSTLTAAVCLYCFCCEGEPAPHILVAATTGAQAKKVFDPARLMARRTPELCEAFSLQVWAKSITEPTGGYFTTINSKANTQDGHNPHVVVLDELHAHKDRGLHDVMRSSFGARRNPLLFAITTAGFNVAGVCYEQRVLVGKILEGAVEADHYFGIIYTLDEGDDPFDESVWIKANPLLGVSVTVAELRGMAKEAQASPESEGEFKTRRMNVWLGAGAAWLNVAQWRACAGALDWADFARRCDEVCIGLDMADKDDIAAVVVSGIDRETGQLLVKPKFWLPEAVLHGGNHAQGREDAPYRTWAAQGYLHLLEGDWIDERVIEQQIRDWVGALPVKRIVADQFAAARSMVARLNEDLGSVDDPLAVVLPKSAKSVTDPAKEFEARIKSGAARLLHDGNPVMLWCVSNVVVTRRIDGTLIPKKETATSANKIDGVDAAINSIASMIYTDETRRVIEYEPGRMG